MIRGRLHRLRGPRRDQAEGEYIEIDPSELTGVLAAPSWLRDGGITAWLLVGVFLFVAGVIWLVSLTNTIVLPVIAATVIATVAGPIVSWLARHHVPRLRRRDPPAARTRRAGRAGRRTSS